MLKISPASVVVGLQKKFMFSRFGCQFEAGAGVVASVLPLMQLVFFPLALRDGWRFNALDTQRRLDPRMNHFETSKWKGPHSVLHCIPCGQHIPPARCIVCFAMSGSPSFHPGVQSK